jgi:hypothetical protein
MRAMILGGLLIALAICAVSALADPPQSAAKQLGEMNLWFIITGDPVKLIQAWDDPKRKSEPILDEPVFLVPDRTFGLGLIFANCPVGPDGRCHATATYRILTPSGALAMEKQDLTLWRDAPPTKDHRELGQCLWRTNAETTDPLGKYVFQAVVTDHVNNKKVTLERTIELRAKSSK